MAGRLQRRRAVALLRVGDVLREDRDSATSRAAGSTMLMRKPPLERLKAALDDALEPLWPGDPQADHEPQDGREVPGRRDEDHRLRRGPWLRGADRGPLP